MREGRRFPYGARRFSTGPILLTLVALLAAPPPSQGRESERPLSRLQTSSRQAARRSDSQTQRARNESARLVEAYGKLPLHFEANEGQADREVKFLSRGQGYTMFLTANEAVLVLRHSTGQAGRGAAEAASKADGHDSSADALLRVKLLGANPAAEVTGLNELPGISNYFLGNDPKNWRTNVPNYGKVLYKNVYPGVDLVYYGNQRQLEYDWVIAPGADPNAIKFAVSGTGDRNSAARLKIDSNGDLVISTEGGEMRFNKPVVYQEAGTGGRGLGAGELQVLPNPGNYQSSTGNRKFLEGRYVLTADNQIHFEIPNYDKSRPLVIDPTLSYSTYLGGSGADGALGIALDSSNNAYITGGTTSTDFPPLSGVAPNTYAGGPATCGAEFAFECGDVFVTKLNSTGTALVYSTYLGGIDRDFGADIAVDSSGNAYVVGTTHSTNFPTTTGAYQTSLVVNKGAYIVKLAPAGSSLVYSTYLSSPVATDFGVEGSGIAVDSSGDAYVTGNTNAASFPTTANAYQSGLGTGTCGAAPCPDAYITEVNPAGTGLVYSTYLGGSSEDSGYRIALDSSGKVYVSGLTASTNFPIINGYQTSFAGGGTSCGGSGLICGDAFVVKMDVTQPPTSALVYSTYLGGSGEDSATGLAVNSSGDIYVTGGTDSTNFPVTTGAAQSTSGGGTSDCATSGLACGDAFVAKIDPTQSGTPSLIYSTYLGGSGDEIGLGIALDASGDAHVTGITNSSGFPVSGDALQTYGGGTSSCTGGAACGDAFLTKLNAQGTFIIYSTFLGGTGDDGGVGVAVDSSGTAYLAGATESTDFPTVTGASVDQTCGSDGTCNGTFDAFAAQVTGLQLPVAAASPTSLTFASTGIGFTTAAQTVTLKNDGDVAMYFSIGMSGNFAQTNTCGNPLAAGTGCTISVTFTPAAAGTLTGNLTVSYNNRSLPAVTVSLTGTGIPAPQAGLSPLTLLFGDQIVSTASSSQPVTLTNNGTAVMTITNIGTTGDFSQTSNCPIYTPTFPVTLGIGANCTINVTFSPTALGSTVQSLSITDDAPGSPQTVSLTGRGVSAAVATLPTTPLTFANQVVGTTSTAQPITLTNNGAAPLGSLSIGTTGDFAETNDCGTSLAVSASCTINVTFTPTTIGSRPGSVSVTDDAAGSPQSIGLSGTGIAPQVQLLPSSLDFGIQAVGTTSPPQTVKLTNVGTSTLNISSIAATGDYAQTNNCGTTVAVNASCTITVTFTPAAVGSQNGTVTITDDALGSTQQVIYVSGTGYVMRISPQTIDFGDQVVGTSSSLTAILTNTSQNAVSITGVSTDNLAFTQSNNCGTTLAGGASCSITLTFAPTTTSYQSATLTLTSTAPDSPTTVYLQGNGVVVTLSPLSLFFGDQGVGTTSAAQTLTLSNKGQTAINITGITSASDFPSTNNCGTSLGAGASCTISVTFVPSFIGRDSENLNVSTDAGSLYSTLIGTGVIVKASSRILFFDPQSVGATSTAQTVTLTNTGSSAVSISAATTGDFAQTNTCGSSLAAGANCSVSVTFTPTVTGPRSGYLTVTTSAGDSPNLVALFGASPIRNLPGFMAKVFYPNDDDSTPRVPLPFTINFFGNQYGSLFVNNNGNVTFDTALSEFTPFNLTSTQTVIIAPFFADVDTRGAGSGLVTYGTDTVNGRPAFGVNWFTVGYYGGNYDKLNTFQLVLIDRSDLAPGDFDIELNYGKIQWETGDASGGSNGLGGSSARAGFSNGSGAAGTFYEVPGSAVNGALLDSNPTTGLIHIGLNSTFLGRLVFDTRGGGVIPPGLLVSPTALALEGTPLDRTCAPGTVTVTNTGSSPLTITSLSTGTTEFVATSACPASIAPGTSCAVSVVFHPLQTGTRTATLTIASNAPNSPATVSLTAQGLPRCPLTALAKSQTLLRGTDRTTFTVLPDTNCQSTEPMQLVCANQGPLRCDFNPTTIQNPERSLLTVSNLRAVTENSMAWAVQGGQPGETPHGMELEVLFADFSFTPYPPQVTVGAGHAAHYALTVVPVNGLTGRMALTCSGAPAGATCTLTPSTINLGALPVQVQVEVQTASRGLVPPGYGPRGPLPGPGALRWLFLAGLLGLMLGAMAAAKRQARLRLSLRLSLGLVLLGLVAWASCGGGGMSPTGGASGTPAGSYSLVVSGTLTPAAGSAGASAGTTTLMHQTRLTLNVN